MIYVLYVFEIFIIAPSMMNSPNHPRIFEFPRETLVETSLFGCHSKSKMSTTHHKTKINI